jgi:hypothetical protein
MLKCQLRLPVPAKQVGKEGTARRLPTLTLPVLCTLKVNHHQACVVACMTPQGKLCEVASDLNAKAGSCREGLRC